MKTIALTFALLALCGEVAARDASSGDGLGNPEIEGYLSVCTRAVSQRESAYRGLLDKPLSCGARLANGPLIARSSKQYRERFDTAARQIIQQSGGDAQGTRSACEYMALACIERHPDLSPRQKLAALQAIGVEANDHLDHHLESSP